MNRQVSETRRVPMKDPRFCLMFVGKGTATRPLAVGSN
jgi:hypothetical protein